MCSELSTITVETKPGNMLVVTLNQDSILDGELVETFQREFLELTKDGGCILLNLRGVKILSGKLVFFIWRVHKKMEESGEKLVLCNLDPESSLFRSIKTKKFLKVFHIAENEEKALSKF